MGSDFSKCFDIEPSQSLQPFDHNFKKHKEIELEVKPEPNQSKQKSNNEYKFTPDPSAPGFDFKGYHRLYIIELKPVNILIPDNHICVKYGRGSKHRPIESAKDFIKHYPYRIHVFSFDDKQVTIDKENKIKIYNKKAYQPGIKIGSGQKHDSTETLMLTNASFTKLLEFMKINCNNYGSWNFRMWYDTCGEIQYTYS